MATPNDNAVATTTFDRNDTDVPWLVWNAKWGGALGAGVTLPYSFSVNSGTFKNNYGNGELNEPAAIVPLTAHEQGAIVTAMAQWALVADIRFVFTPETTTSVGEIRFGVTNNNPGRTGHAYLPEDAPEAGDIWFNPANWNDALTPGSFDYYVILHEIGHALGLEHSFEDPPVAPAQFDNHLYTVMAYRAGPNSPAEGGFSSFYPTTPMFYDILAMQSMYGENLVGNAGDTTYVFNQGTRYFQTIYDSGGVDTIRFNGAESCTINLNIGAFSRLSATIVFDGIGSKETVCIGPSTFIETAIGGSGSDTLIGNAAANTLEGGAGSDTLNGSGGADTASYANSAGSVRINLGEGVGQNGDAQGDTLTSIENVVGSSADDEISGSATANVLAGGSGSDNLNGANGDDTLIGGAGADTLNGSAGIDVADYSASLERVRVNLSNGTGFEGDAQGDVLISIEDIIGSSLDDELTGSNAANRLLGGGGDDTLLGGGGDDELDGGGGGDHFDGGAGLDTARYIAAAGAVLASLLPGQPQSGAAAGDSFLGIENLIGSVFGDTLIGSGEANSLNGWSGDDTLVGGFGADALNGSSGADTADYAGSGGRVRINLTTGRGVGADAEGDTLVSVENVSGSIYNDNLVGSSAINLLIGGGGNDALDGMGGDDVLKGGIGADIVDGGSGIDTATYSASTSRVRVNLNAGVATDGDAAGDTLIGVENVTGSDFNDGLTGSAAANVLSGRAGADTIAAGEGSDTLSGGAGADVFIFNTTPGPGNIDTITDFSAGADMIWFDNAVFMGLATGALSAAAFHVGAAAHDSSDRIVYDATTGILLYDADGNGAGASVQVAVLAPGLAISADDFLVI